MKKSIFTALCIVALFLVCSCSKGESEKYITVNPSELITVEEMLPYIGYTPVMSEELSRRGSIATYVSDPVGKADSASITVYQESGLLTKEKVKEYFDECKNMRSDAEELTTLGVEAFIAFPSVHYYVDGYHIKITAGSGNSDAQRALLSGLAEITFENLLEITKIEVGNESETE